MTYELNYVVPDKVVPMSNMSDSNQPCQVCGWQVYIWFEDTYIDHNPNGIMSNSGVYIHRHCFQALD